MLAQNEINSSVVLTVHGLDDVRPANSNTKYSVVALSNGQPLYGTNHVGTSTGWNDSFAINLKDVQYDDLVLAVLVDENEQYGRASLSLLDLSKGYSGSQNESFTYPLVGRNGQTAGQIHVSIRKLLKEQIIGGLVPPTISLRSDVAPVSSIVHEARGIEKVQAEQLNFFSCMDAKDLGWEPYPIKFKSRIRQQYDVKKSVLELQRLSASGADHQIL